MILGREPAVGEQPGDPGGRGGVRVVREDLGERGAAQETSPRRSGNLGEREPAGVGARGRGAREGHFSGGLGWSTPPLPVFPLSLFCCLLAPSITDDSSAF